MKAESERCDACGAWLEDADLPAPPTWTLVEELRGRIRQIGTDLNTWKLTGIVFMFISAVLFALLVSRWIR